MKTVQIKVQKRYTTDPRIRDVFLLTVYLLCVHFLFLNIYRRTFASSYDGQLFIFSLNRRKYLFCLLETFIVGLFCLKKLHGDGLVDKAFYYLYMLYFLPGFVQQAVTNSAWNYIFYFGLFWAFCELWSDVIKPFSRIKVFVRYNSAFSDDLLYVLSFIAVAVSFGLIFYTHTSFSLSSIRYALENVYEVRAHGKSTSIHWIINNLEYWAAYFSIFMIGYYSEKRKWWMVCVLLLAEFCFFLIQANRILLFLSAVAIALGLIKMDSKKTAWCFAVIGVLLVVDAVLYERGFILTDIFRRYSIVPNRISEKYFEYFQTHEPDLLRSKYDRITQLFSLESPYESPSISMIIGSTYFNEGMNANNGLVGGAVFGYGKCGFFVSSFTLVLALRLFERATVHYRNSNLIDTIAFALSTLVINMPYILANILSITYYLFLFVCLMIINCAYSNEKAVGGKRFER